MDQISTVGLRPRFANTELCAVYGRQVGMDPISTVGLRLQVLVVDEGDGLGQDVGMDQISMVGLRLPVGVIGLLGAGIGVGMAQISAVGLRRYRVDGDNALRLAIVGMDPISTVGIAASPPALKKQKQSNLAGRDASAPREALRR